MSQVVTAEFDITKWDEEPYREHGEGPELSRATVHKTFNGELAGESIAELLMCKADPGDFTAGAGYLASERFSGSIGTLTGSFVIQHGGLSGGGDEEAFGHVVPGSGTDDLTGISGDVEISQDDDGGHTFTMKYNLDDDSETE